mmetsp:Transcript_56663/g.91739  ORF Transcript_56663/g.91739 Transcript_56663/m.91739 type:complete len:204 (-) Transcript_56663:342-953(-)
MQTNDYLHEPARVKIRRYCTHYAVVGTALAPAIVSVADQIRPEFLRLLGVLADKQNCNYSALISAEEVIGGEAFAWSRARTFSFNKNSIGKASTYATATRLHLSVHSADPPALCKAAVEAGQPMSSAECLTHSAAHASHPYFLVLLSTWVVVPIASRHLLLLFMQMHLQRQMWLLMIPTLPAASQPLTDLQPSLELPAHTARR